MSRTAQGTLTAASILIAITCAMAMTVAWGPKDECAAQFPKIIGCALASYEGLAGGLIAVGGALFAAWIAWTAVQIQVHSSEELARRREDATYEVICSELRPIIDLLALVWRVVDRALQERDQETARHGGSLVRAFWPGAKAMLAELSGIEKISDDLDPQRRRQFVEVMVRLRVLFRQIDEERAAAEREDRNFLQIVRALLSHLDRDMRVFDPTGVAAFDGRQRAEIEARSTAEQLEPLVRQFEREGRV